ncbi:MAG: hypothetical protein HC876_01670 [Chloroflexaceae bacterium]|nr:hypothetical protein [Chloroflexaceae bacterium]NJO04334.1 hypothetical protein [Chloroflexaceae bacterium]
MKHNYNQPPCAEHQQQHLSRIYRRVLWQLKNTHALHKELAWELDDVEYSLRSLRGQQDGPTDRLLEREITLLERRRATLEDRVLRELLRIDELTARVETTRHALTRSGCWN